MTEPMTKPDLMAELAEVVRRRRMATSLESVLRANQDAADYLTEHHAELEAVVRDAKAWRALCSDCDKGPQHDTPLSVITDALYLGSGALERHYMHNSAREG